MSSKGDRLGWATLRWTAGMRFRSEPASGQAGSREHLRSRTFSVPIASRLLYAADSMVREVLLDLEDGFAMRLRVHSAMWDESTEPPLIVTGELQANWIHKFPDTLGHRPPAKSGILGIHARGSEGFDTLVTAMSGDGQAASFRYEVVSRVEPLGREAGGEGAKPPTDAVVELSKAAARERWGALGSREMTGPGALPKTAAGD